MSELLEFKNIFFAYHQQANNEAVDDSVLDRIGLENRQILQNLSFAVNRGEWVALLGSNGSGKSTLARLANGLLLPTGGAVIVEGISSWQHDELIELRKRVGLVTQDPDNQIVSTTVFDEVAFGPQNLGWEPKHIYQAVAEALEKVGLTDKTFIQRDPHTLSGGEKQRVVIAATLAMNPHYLILDEPTAMLDPFSRAQVLKAIADAAHTGHGVLHITHLLKEASYASRVLVLKQGKLVYDGKPEPLLSNQDMLISYGLRAEPKVRGRLPSVNLHAMDADKRTDLDTKSKAGYSDADADEELKLSQVSFGYPETEGKTLVLKAFDVRLEAGDCLLLVGASGSGKSTVLSLAAGLLQPTKGLVHLNGEPPLPGKVGLVFQQPEGQLFAQTLAEDILFGPKNMGMPQGKIAQELVDDVLNAVGLVPAYFKDRSPFSLSGGEARRAAIATTLALGTTFLLLDEPTAGLDARGKIFIYELLQQLLAEGKGMIIATHDPGYFEDLATSRVEM